MSVQASSAARRGSVLLLGVQLRDIRRGALGALGASVGGGRRPVARLGQRASVLAPKGQGGPVAEAGRLLLGGPSWSDGKEPA